MRSLRSYILALAALFVVLMVAAAAALVWQASQFGRAQTRAQLQDTTRALSLLLDSRLDGYRQLLVAISTSEALARKDFAALDRQARAALQDPDAWITVSDRQKQLVNTRLPPGSALPPGRLDPAIWAELDSGKPRICNLAQGLVESQILCVDVPVIRNGRAEYKLSVIFRPRLLQRIIEAQRVPDGRFATILDRNATVIWRNVAPDQFVGSPATPLLRNLMQHAPEGTSRARSLDGVPIEAAFSRSPVSGWTFVVAVPQAEIGAGARHALRDGGLLAALLLAAALAIALVAARAVGGDIGRLAAAVQRVRAGEPAAFGPARFEEFGSLAALLAQTVAERNESRERFELAQEVGGVGAWNWDSLRDEGRVSDTYKRMHGLEHVEGPLKFEQVLAVVHPDDREGYLARLRAALDQRGPSTNEYRVVRPDGSISWVAAKGRPIFDESGRRVGSVGIVRDATAEHEAEEALRRLNEVLERQVEERTLERDRLWNIARDPFVVADDKGVWLAASPAWEALLGYPLEAFLGRTSEWIEHPDDVARTRAEDRRLAEGQVVERFENRFRAKDGGYRWLSWTSVPEGGRFYSVARDVTAEKEQAEALRKTEEALRQAQKMESIGQITGGVAHDFNNLLMPIIGALDLLQQRGLPDTRAERMVGNALEAAERARMLVQRLLAFARRQPLQAEPLDVLACLEQIKPLLASTLGPQIHLNLEAATELPHVSADRNQLEMAILNLAVNAKDAMPDGGSLTLTAGLREADGDDADGLTPGRYVELSIADTGMGMPPSVAERAIEPFFSTKGLGRGTGLGLSMVHGLMAQLGGGMRIASALGQGTTIRLWLRATEAPGAAPLPQSAPAMTASRAGRALLVEDEALVRASTAQMLAGLGYEVVEAANAEQALAHLEQSNVDLVVTDHLMPGMSGAELARVVRARWPAARLLVVSGYADVDDIAPDLPRLAKPFRQAELGAALDRLAPAPALTAGS